MKIEDMATGFGLPENAVHYLSRVGIILNEQDFDNKSLVLSRYCSGNDLYFATKCLESIWRK